MPEERCAECGHPKGQCECCPECGHHECTCLGVDDGELEGWMFGDGDEQ